MPGRADHTDTARHRRKRILFRERAWGDMAESKTYVHLEHLRCLGELERSDPDGVAHYVPVG